MKYGREYSDALASAEFPAAWVSSAISYRELKKSLKKVQQELIDLGLDAETLKHMTSSFGVRRSSIAPLTDAEASSFAPELWIAVDSKTGQFVGAGLTDETKAKLSQGSCALEASEHSLNEDTNGNGQTHVCHDGERISVTDIEWTQIPLSTVTSFFASIDPKLAALGILQDAEASRLESSIIMLGEEISTLTEPPRSLSKFHKAKSQVDVETWRELFSLYIDSTVFFSSHEQDHGTRNYAKAKAQLELFSTNLVKQDIVRKFKMPKSKAAFDRFVNINLDILRVMRFQEINALAVRKIVKKFDKRTALGAAQTYHGAALSGPFARSIAKDMCAQVSSKVVAVVPQMDDFVCPICYSLAWRPIRLGCCNSIFCIRCIIKLQREGEARCPMCRQPTVGLANGSHIDDKTAAYLMRYFPKEVKERQKANERAAGVDKYGEDFYKHDCTMM